MLVQEVGVSVLVVNLVTAWENARATRDHPVPRTKRRAFLLGKEVEGGHGLMPEVPKE